MYALHVHVTMKTCFFRDGTDRVMSSKHVKFEHIKSDWRIFKPISVYFLTANDNQQKKNDTLLHLSLLSTRGQVTWELLVSLRLVIWQLGPCTRFLPNTRATFPRFLMYTLSWYAKTGIPTNQNAHIQTKGYKDEIFREML